MTGQFWKILLSLIAVLACVIAVGYGGTLGLTYSFGCIYDTSSLNTKLPWLDWNEYWEYSAPGHGMAFPVALLIAWGGLLRRRRSDGWLENE